MGKKMKEWEGPLEDLVKFGCREVLEFWVVKLNGKTYEIGKKTLYESEGKAKGALKKHLYYNYCQGHYWHKGKNNTFAHEKGWMHNGGPIGGLDKLFKVMGAETAEWLLERKIFTIEKLRL